ncbi:MAG: DEAD/DEAH box helicase [Aquimonas sp.]|nr:DEAD/DEAH box helicase [Aquimonas sp.]
MSFETLGLSSPLLRALADLGYTQPTEIQQQAIPHVLEGRDVLAGAQTGTGKTAAFALPLLQRLAAGTPAQSKRPRALVLTPTRELAAQVQESVREYGKQLRIRSTTVFGGVGMMPQVEALRRGVDILVATPGRLIDHLGQGTIDLSQVEVLVLDEADRMLDMGFLPAIRRILAKLPTKRQSLLFSATFAEPIRELAQQFLNDPVEIQVETRNSTVAMIEHVVYPVESARKRDLLLHVLSEDSRRQTLVFSRTKHGADRLVRQLEAAGHRAAAIHGNKSQGARTKALGDFKSGRITTLVATDIAARGIDIDQLPTVINFDLPMVAEDYVHRIGRTGRNGSTGHAISLVSQDEAGQLRDIHRLIGREIPQQTVPGFEPAQALRLGGPLPRPAGSARPQQRRGSSGRPGGGRPGGGRPGSGGTAKPSSPSASQPRRAQGGERAR